MISASSADASFRAANVFLGDHEHVRRRLRIDVLERKGVLVFVDFLGRNFTGNDAAEQAVFHDDVRLRDFRLI